MYSLELTPKAKRELDELPLKDFRRVDTAIWALAANPRPHGVKKLKGPIHRIRVGDCRVTYAVFDKDQLVIVGKVARCAEDTYDKMDALF